MYRREVSPMRWLHRLYTKDITAEDRERLQGGVVGLIERGGLDQDSLVETLRSQLSASGLAGED